MPGPLDWFMQMLGGQIPAQGGQILQGQNPQGGGGGGYAPNGIASSGPGIMKPPIQQAIMQSPAGAERMAPDEAFQNWYQQRASQWGLNPNPDDPRQFYDYRAAWRNGAEPDETGHWPSDFKLHGHPNENVGGYSTISGQRVPGTPGLNAQELIKRGWAPNSSVVQALLNKRTQ